MQILTEMFKPQFLSVIVSVTIQTESDIMIVIVVKLAQAFYNFEIYSNQFIVKWSNQLTSKSDIG